MAKGQIRLELRVKRRKINYSKAMNFIHCANGYIGNMDFCSNDSAIDENGNYVSSDVQTYGWHFLSTYVIKQAEACSVLGVTYIDHLYGTITEANADLYLSDHIHLNPEGRQLIADRFLKALYHYQNRD